MMHLYVYSLLAGLFGANGVPHFVRGITGEKFRSPFGRPSSAVVNVLWGWFNFAVGMIFLHYAHPRTHEIRAFAFVALGALIIGLFSAVEFSKHPEYNG